MQQGHTISLQKFEKGCQMLNKILKKINLRKSHKMVITKRLIFHSKAIPISYSPLLATLLHVSFIKLKIEMTEKYFSFLKKKFQHYMKTNQQTIIQTCYTRCTVRKVKGKVKLDLILLNHSIFSFIWKLFFHKIE